MVKKTEKRIFYKSDRLNDLALKFEKRLGREMTHEEWSLALDAYYEGAKDGVLDLGARLMADRA